MQVVALRFHRRITDLSSTTYLRVTMEAPMHRGGRVNKWWRSLEAQPSKPFNRSDVFTNEALKEESVCYAEVVIDDGKIVVDRRSSIESPQNTKTP